MEKRRKLLKNNPYYVLRVLCSSVNIKFSSIWHNQHKKDPKYPLLSSYYRILKNKNIECVMVKSSVAELPLLPMPAIIYTSLNNGTSFVVERVDNANIYVRNEKNDIESIELALLNHFWDGNILIINREHAIVLPKEDLSDKVMSIVDKLRYPLLVIALFIVVCYVFLTQLGSRSLFNILFILLYIIGILTAGLLQMRQINRNNEFVNKICHSKSNNKKVDCSSVLDSKDAYFLGIFSWTDFGTLFFLTLFFLTLILPGNLSETVGILSSIFAFPYVFYSVLYQWLVAKSWCRLCLATQVVIVMLCALSIVCLSINEISLKSLISSDLLPATIIILTSVIVYVYGKPVFEKGLHYKMLKAQNDRLKHNPAVLEAIFSQQSIISSNEIDHIVLSPEASDRITMIYNTTCRPCNREMTDLIDLYKRKFDVGLEIIFLLNEADIASIHIAKIIYSKYLSNNHQVLDFLYHYASNFPSSAKKTKNMELPPHQEIELDNLIISQNNWCRKSNITSTPLLYFNDRLIPKIYSLHDIDTMCV